MNEHVIDDLDAYALGALDRADAERVAAHLAACESCRREAAELAEVVGTLPDTVPVREPRGALRDRVIAAARTEERTERSAGRPWSLGRVRPLPVALAGLAAAVIVLGAIDVDMYQRMTGASSQRDNLHAVVDSMRQGGRWWYMAGKDEFAGAGGTLVDPRAEGRAPFVLFHDLPRLPAGKVLTVWLVSPDSTWAPVATFRPDGQEFQMVAINMEVAGFDRCAVTIESSSWSPPSRAVVMESRIGPPPPASP